jgi:hypothetical protein
MLARRFSGAGLRRGIRGSRSGQLAFDPSTFTSKQAWYRDNFTLGAAPDIATIVDDSGNTGRDITHATAANRPHDDTRLGQRAALFDGTDDFLANVGGIDIAQPYTWLIVCEPIVDGVARFILAGATAAKSCDLSITAGNVWSMNCGSAITGGTATSAGHVIVATANGASSTLHVDNMLDGAPVANGNAGAEVHQLHLHGTNTAGSQFFRGYMCEALLLGFAATEADRRNFARYARDRYTGLSLTF